MVLPTPATLFEHAGRVLVFFVLQQPVDQFLARIGQRRIFLIAVRQHQPTFDFQQRAGHFHKLADGAQIKLFEQLRYSMNCEVMGAIGMSVISTSCLRTR